jgi:basic amino acid/polyamine antiporter, APA family
MNTSEGLKREIGLWGLTSNIINVVIGSGIFALPALVSEGLGSAGILAYLFCGFLITLIMLCFAEVGSKVTLTGGAYAYIEEAFGKYFGFLTSILLIFGTSLLATAAVANILIDNFAKIFPLFTDSYFRAAFIIVVFSGLAIVNIIGIKEGITLVQLVTLAKLIPLLLLIIWGSTEIVYSNLLWQNEPVFSDIGKTSLLLFFAFQGAESSLSVSGEVKNPKKTVSRGILLSFLIILVIYMGVHIVAQGVLGDSLVNFKETPLAEVAKRIMGPAGFMIMIIGATISTFGYLTSDQLNMSRVLFRSAKDRVIPIRPLSLVHRKFATPYVAVITFAALGCLFAIKGEFKTLAILSSSSVLLVYLGVALSTIKLRYSKVFDDATFKIPGGIAIPILAIITIIWFLSCLSNKEMIGMGIFLIILSVIFGVIKYFKLDRQKEINNE